MCTSRSCGADGTVRLWSLKTCECQQVITSLGGLSTSSTAALLAAGAASGAGPSAPGEVNVHSVHLLPRHPDQFLVCNRTNTLFILNLQGQVSPYWPALPPFLLQILFFFFFSSSFKLFLLVASSSSQLFRLHIEQLLD